jgi:BTB And C-terminal Kelch
MAALLTYIGDKFGQLTTRSMSDIQHPVSHLKANELSVLLCDKYLNVKSEDEVVDALITWFHNNIDSTDDRSIVDDLMRNVNWPYVSFERILDLYRTFPRLR